MYVDRCRDISRVYLSHIRGIIQAQVFKVVILIKIIKRLHIRNEVEWLTWRGIQLVKNISTNPFEIRLH